MIVKIITINYIDKVSFFFIRKIFMTFVFAHFASTTAKGKQKQQSKQKKKKKQQQQVRLILQVFILHISL